MMRWLLCLLVGAVVAGAAQRAAIHRPPGVTLH